MTTPVPLAFLSGAPGPGEVIVLFLAVLILFGPRRLPEIARAIGKIISQLRRASQDFHDQIMRIDEPPRRVKSPAPDPEEYAAAAEATDKAGRDSQAATAEPPDAANASTGEKKDDLAG